jgi:hypothetical protein
MSRMPVLTVSPGILLLHAAALPAAAVVTTTPPDLWPKAVALSRVGPHLEPRKLHEKMEILDGAGAVTSVTETWVDLAPDGGGPLRRHTTRAVRDGRDITAKVQAQEASSGGRTPKKGRSVTISPDYDPFAGNVQAGVVATRLGEEEVDGRRCATYDYTQEGSVTYDGKRRGAEYRGEAWLDVSSGRPLRIEYSQQPLPPKVKQLKTTVRYDLHPSGKIVIAQVQAEGLAGFLFFKRRFRLTLDLGDYAVSADPPQ